MLDLLRGGFALLGMIATGAIVIDVMMWLQKKISHKQIIPWKNEEEWEHKVSCCAEKWLKKMPAVPLKDEERLVLIDILRKQYKHNALQNWQYAQLVSGLYANRTRTQNNFDIKSFHISEVDDGYAVYQMWKTGMIEDSEALLLTEQFLQIVKRRTKNNGLIEYREGFGDICIVDTLAFVCPLLVRYGAKTGNQGYVELAMNQIKTYHAYGYLEKYGLYAHGYNSATHIPCESVGWGRGTGWYLLGILYCYQEINVKEEKDWLYERMIEAADNILKYQRDDGGWSTQLVSNWNYDSSATAIFGTFLYHVYKIVENEKYKQAGDKALTRLMNSTRKDGAIENCEGACHGVGKYSIRYGISPFVQGMVLDMIAAKKD